MYRHRAPRPSCERESEETFLQSRKAADERRRRSAGKTCQAGRLLARHCGRKCVGLPVSPSLRFPRVAVSTEEGEGGRGGREGEEKKEEAAAVSLCVGERRSERGARAFFVEAGSTDRRLQTDSEPTIAFGGRLSSLPSFIPPSPSSASASSVLFLYAEYALLIRRRRRRPQ